MRNRDNHDIKAPDGYVLGGLRKVRNGGIILFNRGYWQVPEAFVSSFEGEKVWVHEAWVGSLEGGEKIALEAANPGLHIYEAREMKMTVICHGADKADAKNIARTPHRKAWFARQQTKDDSNDWYSAVQLEEIERQREATS